jgi:type IV secretory pathway VirB4 component
MRRARRSERPGHSATSAHAQAAYPFQAGGGLGRPGAYIGRDAYGGSFLYDPWQLYQHGLSGQNMIVLGKIANGKSSLVKTYILRQRVFAHQSWVLDIKGEFGPLCAAMGGTHLALRPDGEIRLNPIDRRGGRVMQITLLRSVAKASLGRELLPEEDAGVRVALDLVNSVCEGEPVLPEVVDALLHPRAVMIEGVSAKSAEHFAEANREVALGLQRLCEGDLRGMFDGPTSTGLDLDAPLVVIDLSAVRDSAAVAILMTCASAWQHAIMFERAQVAEAGGGPGVKIISVIEEGWRVTGHIGVAEWLRESFKLCRKYGVQTILVLHHITDLGGSGDVGSREARIAEGLIGDTDTFVYYAQHPDHIEETRARTGLSETEAEIVLSLRPYEALWKVGQRPELVRHMVSRREEPIVYTDARLMSEGPPA